MKTRDRFTGLPALIGVFVCAALTAGSSQGAVLLVPEEYATLRLAMEAAGVTDTVSVGPGTYTGAGNRNIEVTDKSVLIRSRAGADQTIIDCQHAGSAFRFEGYGYSPGIEGFTFRNGSGDVGGAVFAASPALHVVSCVFVGNDGGEGGAISALFRGTVEDCVFLDNFASGGGGAASTLGSADPLTFRRCLFARNWANDFGGAILSHSGTLLLEDCTLVDNVSAMTGGGIHCFAAPVTLERTICRGNWAGYGQGSEIYITGAHIPLTIRCSDVRLAGVSAANLTLEEVIDADARFCDPWSADYTLRSDSPCLPGGNPCGVQIGALGLGCLAPGIGACCLADGSCVLDTQAGCDGQHGVYLGDGVECLPDPCAATPIVPTSWGRIKAAYR